MLDVFYSCREFNTFMLCVGVIYFFGYILHESIRALDPSYRNPYTLLHETAERRWQF